ncbi:sigma-70 family RNA polymerase sigma factor [Streptosporangium sp. NBC_01639]|uniref:RNA polymerase sigma factor n=1 Tax=unclassified Streptosporangium TaxID=2632669 RepID=UPI002DD81231|nr:sigma-70 family RNA polymerase sigma factor [Streptosporangium sp. NBC_01756]WSC87733.1 sigma-70 family RNA polymerase sigma factor [Streptosporangium sp. NBC_01756]WTD53590.1 sigma-70 family RNA polymerase sigma factor [Streptosporangium sp. NBC_01639]
MSEDDEEKWFDWMFRTFYGPVWAYAARRVDRAVADDIASCTFHTAWRKRQRLPRGDDRAVVAWLYRVAWGHVRNATRGERRRQRLAGLLRQLPPDLPAGGSHDEEEFRTAMETAMARLRPKDGEILRLHYWEDLTVEEIGAILGLTPNAVRVRLSRARLRLGDLLRGTRLECGEGER